MTRHNVILTSTSSVRAMIAHTILRNDSASPYAGHVTLYPHQLDALSRIQSALKSFPGALLCDDVGLGKTYVALALAITYPRTLIISPAKLHAMWMEARTRTYVDITYTSDLISLESLSYRPPTRTRYDLIIVDEAHHVRNAHTKRYRHLARLCDDTHVLLMSATPIHNSKKDLLNLLTLFLKDQALTLTPEEIACLLIRRTYAQTHLVHKHPQQRTTHWITAPISHTLLSPILDLPPPLPPRTAGNAPHLTKLALLRQWCSSDSTLRKAIHRRRTQATALLESLRTGHYPTAQELRAWLLHDNTIQLAFPQLIVPPTDNTPNEITALYEVVHTHAQALHHLEDQIPTPSAAENRKITLLRKIRAYHSNARIVAFSQYADTIITLFHALKSDGHVAAITGRNSYIVTGPIDRTLLIKRFAPVANDAPPAHTRDDITFLLATDLLSEGVNLQDASVIIHLDIPWTAATLNQRIGRIARIGSPHAQISIYGFIPPPEVDAILRTTTIVNRKARLAQRILGELPRNVRSPLPQQSTEPLSQSRINNHHTSIPEHTESIRAILQTWLTQSLSNDPQSHNQSHTNTLPPCHIATTPARISGLLAACLINDTPSLLTSTTRGQISQHPKHIHHTLRAIKYTATPHSTPPQRVRYQSALTQITRWHTNLQASMDAGLHHIPPLTHPAAKRTQSQFRKLSQTLAMTPWSHRPQLAQKTTPTRYTTPATPTLTFHVIALLLLIPSD